MKIVLLGYMGCGKSSIGIALAKKININFIDLDAYIEASENLLIAEIFKQKGEIYFRKQESFYLKQILSTSESFVLSLGGGTPCYGNNESFYLNNPEIKTVYLRAKIDTLYNRLILEKQKRPLIANFNDSELKEFIAKHLFERNSFYSKAPFKIDVDNKSISEIVNEIAVLT